MSSRPPVHSSPTRVLSAGPRQGRKTKDPDRERLEDRERVEELQKQVEYVLKENSLNATGRRNYRIITILLIFFTILNFSVVFGYTEVRLKTQRDKFRTQNNQIKLFFEKMLEDTNDRIKENKEHINSCEEKLKEAKPKVAFGVQKSASIKGVVKFESEEVDNMNCFNMETGRFAVPISGTYFFSWNVLSLSPITKLQENSIGTYIRVNERKKSAFALGKTGYGIVIDIASSAVIDLKEGQQVDLYSNDTIQDGDYAAFNGFLLHTN